MKAFITYSHEDSEFVDKLVKDLNSSGLNVVLDEKILTPGDSLIKNWDQYQFGALGV